MLVLVIVLSVLIVGLAVGFIGFAVYVGKKNKSVEVNKDLEEKYKDLDMAYIDLVNTFDKVNASNHRLHDENNGLLGQIKLLGEQVSTLQGQVVDRAAASCEEQVLLKRVEELRGTANGLQMQVDEHLNRNKALSDREEELRVTIDAAQRLLEELSGRNEVLKSEGARLNGELERLKESHLAVLRSENEVAGRTVGRMVLSGKEERLVGLFEEIGDNYTELRADIATLAWKRVWLPHMQELVKRLDVSGKSGIYRLTLIGEDGVCYIGQAKDFKERWYQHCKKMVGVDNKGNEKLYEGHLPTDFEWEVVEECESSVLNEREHWWIDYCASVEYGLNRKG